MEYVIKVKDLTKSYQNKPALKGIDFRVKKGEIFGFLGPSGSGKSTTIKILTAQLQCTTGEVEVFGQPLATYSPQAYMKQIGVLTDNAGLYERLSIVENLKLFAGLYGIDECKINQVLMDVNLLDEKKKPVKKCSKGMRQRVTIARALLHEPTLLFLDEPTVGLDPVNVQQIHNSLRRLNDAGTTIFLTTHNMQEAEDLCHRIAFLHDGVISTLDTPKNLRRQYGENTITLRLHDGQEEVILLDKAGAEKITQYINEGTLQTIHSNEATLGDIFVKITGRELT